MEKTRQIKIISLCALLVAVLGLTVAFAALSQTLTIAVISKGNFFNPCKSTESPVPPPKTTTFLFINPPCYFI